MCADSTNSFSTALLLASDSNFFWAFSASSASLRASSAARLWASCSACNLASCSSLRRFSSDAFSCCNLSACRCASIAFCCCSINWLRRALPLQPCAPLEAARAVAANASASACAKPTPRGGARKPAGSAPAVGNETPAVAGIVWELEELVACRKSARSNCSGTDAVPMGAAAATPADATERDASSIDGLLYFFDLSLSRVFSLRCFSTSRSCFLLSRSLCRFFSFSLSILFLLEAPALLSEDDERPRCSLRRFAISSRPRSWSRARVCSRLRGGDASFLREDPSCPRFLLEELLLEWLLLVYFSVILLASSASDSAEGLLRSTRAGRIATTGFVSGLCNLPRCLGGLGEPKDRFLSGLGRPGRMLPLVATLPCDRKLPVCNWPP
mmetsp:Transcript_140310/g.349780  ORF Transcript_140310/g.349780 Transcript_140310/m.349780 type:complete len:385 (+) Transcript_140310:3088-4242(+)